MSADWGPDRVFRNPAEGLPPLITCTADGRRTDDGVLIVHRWRLHVTEEPDGTRWFCYRSDDRSGRP